MQRYVGSPIPSALSPGFVANHLTFSPRTYPSVEGFSGILRGHPFILDICHEAAVGLFVGLRYNGQPVYFAAGPAPVFDVLNFTGTDVVFGTPSAGAYMALNLITGHPIVNLKQVVPLKGYTGLMAPDHSLGVPITNWAATVP